MHVSNFTANKIMCDKTMCVCDNFLCEDFDRKMQQILSVAICLENIPDHQSIEGPLYLRQAIRKDRRLNECP